MPKLFITQDHHYLCNWGLPLTFQYRFFFWLGDFNKVSKNRNICLELSNSCGAHYNDGGVVQSD